MQSQRLKRTTLDERDLGISTRGQTLRATAQSGSLRRAPRDVKGAGAARKPPAVHSVPQHRSGHRGQRVSRPRWPNLDR